MFVNLKRGYEEGNNAGTGWEYKRLTLLQEADSRVADLKRQVEKEFADLFPYEPPYIVAKLDDEQGYSLSNNSRVGDFLKYGDKISALPEALGGQNANPMHGGSNTEDLVIMLRNLETSILGKIA